jgi:hypothetical protein
MTYEEALQKSKDEKLAKINGKGMRTFGYYYSVKHSMIIEGEVFDTKAKNKLIIKPFKKVIGSLFVPAHMFQILFSVSDNGTKINHI